MHSNIEAADPSGTSSNLLLEELRKAHTTLLDAIDELKTLTLGPIPPKAILVDTRWKVSSASLARRLLWGRILISLSGLVDPDDRATLLRLQDIDIELLRASIKHVAKWTAEAIFGDWSGYCRASESMRSKMMAAISSEREMLYPILGKVSDLAV